MSFVHLNVHSNHSLLSGASTVEDLVWAAAKHGMEALALTDTNGLYAAVSFQRACAEAGVRPIFGVEVDEPIAPSGGRGVDLGGRAAGEPRVPRTDMRTRESASAFGRSARQEPRPPKWKGASRRHDGNATLRVARQEPRPPTLEIPPDPPRAVLLARDAAGYAGICRLVTERHLGWNWRDLLGRRPGKGPAPDATAHQTLSARPSSETSGDLADAIRRHAKCAFVLTSSESLLESLAEAIPKDSLFAELNHFGDAESRARIHRLARLAARLGVGVVATNRVHFLRPDGHRIHRVLSAIRTNTTVGSLPPHAEVPPEAFFKSPAAMGALFREFPEALARVAEIAAACRVDLELGRPKPPRFPLPPGESAFSLLCKEAFAGLTRRYRPVTRAAWDTFSRELGVIEKLGLADYFLVCWDIVRWARERGMPCLGRGSAANSIVSYCLFITHVDPLRHDLFFERFLNEERTTPPDFDIDFGTDDREEVLDYVFERHGRDRVAMICTLNQMHARSAVRETAKALGVPTSEIDGFVKCLPAFADPDEIEEVLRASPVTRDLPVDEEPLRTLLSIAKRIGGFPRHLATHPCGIVVAPGPITDFMPLQRGDKGLPITQWSMGPVEEAGLIKIDLLGQKGLAVIPEVIRAVEKAEGRSIDPTSVDYLNDPLTRRKMSEGDTEGCFYIESPIMMQLLRQARCEDFETLTALSSIIRPGVSNYGGKQTYLRRHLGLEKVEVPHPILEPILRDTHGCLIYQEQVIRIAARMAGMSLGEADGVRKCMSKKGAWKPMETYKARFYDGARAQGIPGSVIDTVYRQIESFAGYAFCKAHSASFALESFESLYWKAHHPAEFMAAVLSNEGGYYSPSEYVEEARRTGLTILPPHVNRSEVRFTAEIIDPSEPGKRNAVRVGLMRVRDLRREMAEAIVAARRGRPFTSAGDLLDRVPLNKKEAENLVRCGALDGLGPSRPAMLWEVALARSNDASGPTLGGRGAFSESALPAVGTSGRAARAAGDGLHWEGRALDGASRPVLRTGPRGGLGGRAAGEPGLRPDGVGPSHGPDAPVAMGGRGAFSESALPSCQALSARASRGTYGGTSGRPVLSPPAMPEYPLERRLALDLEILDLTVSAHPLALFADRVASVRAKRPTVRSVDLVEHVGETVYAVGWYVTGKLTSTQETKELMEFVTFSDEWGKFEATLFPKTFQRLGLELRCGKGPFLIRGRVESELGLPGLVAMDIALV